MRQDETLTTLKRLDKVSGDHLLLAHVDSGPCVVFVVGMHGNELASVLAAEQWVNTTAYKQAKGSIYILKGNVRALIENQRFIDVDLNRIWSKEHFYEANLPRNPNMPNLPHEYKELIGILNLIYEIISKHKNQPLYFFDLHTTSSQSVPFIPFNDSLANRALAEHFKVPLILGIEEFLDDTFMSFINDLNYPALAFEAGQHEDSLSVLRHACFIKLSLHYAGLLFISNEERLSCHKQISGVVEAHQSGFFDIRYRHNVHPDVQFQMNLGYRSFQEISKGQNLAKDMRGDIKSPTSGLVFMPLYQSQGQDGFFVIKKVSRFWLILSRWLRLCGLSNLVPYMPGIRPHLTKSKAYTIKGFTLGIIGKKFLHLLGYRVKIRANQPVLLVRRD